MDRTPEKFGRFSGLRSYGGALAGRFRFNADATRALLRRRRARNLDSHARIHGWRFLFLVAMVVVLIMVVLDSPVGAFGRAWPNEIRNVARTVTDIGKSGWILIPSGIFLLMCYCLDWSALRARTRRMVAKWMALAAYVFLSVGVSGLAVLVIKYGIGRARPRYYDEYGAFAFKPFSMDAYYASFPSGHSTTAGALFAAVALFFPVLRFPALVLGVWLGFSRVLVGAHYPSDVIAGFALGAWYAYFQAMIFARHGIVFRCNRDGWPVLRTDYYLLSLRRVRRVARTPDLATGD